MHSGFLAAVRAVGALLAAALEEPDPSTPLADQGFAVGLPCASSHDFV